MGILMINCKKAAELICASLDRPLPTGEKCRMYLHLALCAACRNFRKQNKAFLLLMERRFRNPDQSKALALQLTPEACNRIKQRVQQTSAEHEAENDDPK